MNIEHDSQADGGRFSARNEGHVLGHLDYRRLADGVLDAHHTFVDPAARGRGVAEALLHALTAYAQAEQTTILPSCSYVAKKLPNHHPELVAHPTTTWHDGQA